MAKNFRPGPLLAVSAFAFILVGLALTAGGLRLAWLGGSWYYLLAGLAVVVSGALLMRGRRLALGWYALFLAATLAWAVYEVRLDWWQLVPRVAVWVALGVWLLLPGLRRRLNAEDEDMLAFPGGKALAAAVLVSLVVGGLALVDDEHQQRGLVADASMSAKGSPPDQAALDWTAYGHSGRGDRHSPAQHITPSNVGQLQVAWTYHTGDFRGPNDPQEFANEVTPLKANGLLYLCTPHNIVIALDPDTGRERWRFDPKINRDASGYQHMICRGVAYHDATPYADPGAQPAPTGGATAAAASDCPRRILAPTADATIVAVNADNGQPCRGFGQGGAVDLKQDMPFAKPGFLNPTSPPTVSRDVLVAAASVTDNASTKEPSGVIRGYDIATGRLLWNWDPARPDRTEPLRPGMNYVANSPNSWSVASVDEQLGLVYLPMGNQTPDIWGGNRIPEAERFSSAIVALELATGRLRWAYQTVHHDLWDMDIGAQPTLVDLQRPEGAVPALIAATKQGGLYVLDRRDGKPIVPAPERPVPQGAARGDRTAPTQPFSELSFSPPPLRERDMWGTTPFDQLMCRIAFKGLRYEGMFTPPSEQGSLVYPGNYGVFDWGGVSVDPVRQVMVANPNYMAFVSKLYPRGEVDARGGTGSEHGLQPMSGTPYAVELKPLLSPLGIPCQAPPWGYIAAVDLKTMQKAWVLKNGTVRDNAPLPIPLPLGVPSLGGPITTGGAVAFMAASLDQYLRAYDLRSGDTLWKARLPAGGQATPMSYVSEKTGRQYVVVMAGGHGSLGTKLGDSLIAYALPQPADAARGGNGPKVSQAGGKD